MAGLVEARR